ncbi:RICIN domain-containing protein, partial [Streptomyces sp. NPDC093065]|uniref:RICIN domain-containing protein n=1 Tax=Streptomyces sp. NPDC093065 TaxID=3366021 RepID=UPI0037FBC281
YELRPGNVQIEPGRAAFVETTLKPKRIIWFGSKEERPYTLAVRRSGVDPTEVEGTYVQRGFLPRWLATFFGVFLALAIAFVMIWIAYKPQVRTSATEQTQQAGVALAPSPSATPETLPSTAESAPAEQPQVQQPATQESKDDGGGADKGDGDKGGGESKKPDKPAVKPVVPARNILLRNTTSHMCAELPGREKGELDGPVQQAVCDDTDGDNQIWDLEVKYPKAGPGGAPLFQIRNIKDKYCMDLPYHGAAAVGTPVTEFHCDSTTPNDNQLWWVDKQESGAYWIRNFSSNQKCLGVEGANGGALFSKMVLDNCGNVDDQEWEIIHPKKG